MIVSPDDTAPKVPVETYQSKENSSQHLLHQLFPSIRPSTKLCFTVLPMRRLSCDSQDLTHPPNI
jgi:hypothetical protein